MDINALSRPFPNASPNLDLTIHNDPAILQVRSQVKDKPIGELILTQRHAFPIARSPQELRGRRLALQQCLSALQRHLQNVEQVPATANQALLVLECELQKLPRL